MYCLDAIIPIPNHWEIAAYHLAQGSGKENVKIDEFYPNDKSIFAPDEDTQAAIANKLKSKKRRRSVNKL